MALCCACSCMSVSTHPVVFGASAGAVQPCLPGPQKQGACCRGGGGYEACCVAVLIWRGWAVKHSLRPQVNCSLAHGECCDSH